MRSFLLLLLLRCLSVLSISQVRVCVCVFFPPFCRGFIQLSGPKIGRRIMNDDRTTHSSIDFPSSVDQRSAIFKYAILAFHARKDRITLNAPRLAGPFRSQITVVRAYERATMTRVPVSYLVLLKFIP